MSEEIEDGYCSDSIFFLPLMLNRDEEKGQCRRYAPKPLAGGTGTGWSDWEWPTVNDYSWCGEFRRAK